MKIKLCESDILFTERGREAERQRGREAEREMTRISNPSQSTSSSQATSSPYFLFSEPRPMGETGEEKEREEKVSRVSARRAHRDVKAGWQVSQHHTFVKWINFILEGYNPLRLIPNMLLTLSHVLSFTFSLSLS
jgi:hypothetical protein